VTLAIRDARRGDADEIVELIADLGHAMTVEAVRERIGMLEQSDCPQIVAARDDRLIGLCGLHIMSAIHRPRPVGRITILEVAPDCRRQGIGRTLVEAAEQRLRAAGCGLIEVTSNERLVEAHGFYHRLGYEHTSKRFAKDLQASV
jgi:N-acetylglutamate synthase-like GNAT family acetyltransferase